MDTDPTRTSGPSVDPTDSRTEPGEVPPELLALPSYEVRRKVGGGAMGDVYLAYNELMRRLEALKVINKDRLQRPGSKERFLQEIASAGQLGHPNVPPFERIIAPEALADLDLGSLRYRPDSTP